MLVFTRLGEPFAGPWQPGLHDTRTMDQQAARPSPSLKRAVRAGLRTVALVQAISQIVSLGSLAVLYRLLLPDAYGLLGMVMPLLMFLRIFTTWGLPTSTVQRSRLTHAELSSLFWLGLLLGAITALATVLVAPAVAHFFHEGRLVRLTCALAGTSLLVALGMQHQALLERELRVGRLAWVRLAGQLAGAAAAIAAAVAGWGVWALVVQQYVELGALAAGAWWARPWWPGFPRPGTSVRRHLRFGGYFAGSSILFFVATNLDKVLIGRMFDARLLGFYSQAFNLMIKPVYVVTTPLNAVILTSLSRAVGDTAARTELMRAYYRLLAILLFPAGVGLALVGPLVMGVLGGSAWTAAGGLLAVLSLAIPAQGVLHVNVPLLAAAGRTDRLFAASAVLTAVLGAACTAGAVAGRQFGVGPLGVAWGYAGAVAGLIAVPYAVFSLRSANLDPRAVLPVVGRAAAASLAMGLVVGPCRLAAARLPGGWAALELVFLVAVGGAVYAAAARGEIAWLVRHAWARSRGEADRNASTGDARRPEFDRG